MKSSRESNHQGIQTCHLCGKVQCGQRLGRVKCCLCSRIFCLQQLQRKFGITAIANDPEFKCPRCTGICCCVCNCTKPPPHVHCKVYKVRQNKIKPGEPIVKPPLTQFHKDPPITEPHRDVPLYQIQSEPLQRLEKTLPVQINPTEINGIENIRCPTPVDASVPRIPSCSTIEPFSSMFHDESYKNSFEIGKWEQYSNTIQDPQNSWQYSVDAPGSSYRL